MYQCVFVLHMSQLGESALMKAAWWGNTEVIKELVKAGVNLNLQDEVRIYNNINITRCT